jgi:DtxR family transcriptional regulator, Mn-dependent transcriptional regulator
MKSESIEDYLKAIYQIMEEQNGSPVSTTSLAARLGIKSASVTEMLKRLSSGKQKLVEYERYYGVTLSPVGLKIALEIIRHHRLIESYLSRMLGYSWDEVHAEAERLEHVISEEMEDRMAFALGDPITDPHGDPIPDRNGNYNQPDYHSLVDTPEGQPATIRRIIGQEPEFLRYLSELGLVLFTQIEILSKAPFNGPVSIQITGSKEIRLSLGREVAEKILVQPLPNIVTEQTYEHSIRT